MRVLVVEDEPVIAQALIDGLRAVILEGASLGSQWQEMLKLALWGGVTFVLALRLFRWS